MTAVLALPPDLGPVVTLPVASPVRLATDWDGHRCVVAGAAAFVKVLRPGQAATIDIAAVAEAAGLAGLLGIAPRLLGVDAAAQALVFEDLDAAGWHWCYIDDLLDEGPEALLALKRRLHCGGTLTVRRDIFADVTALVRLAEDAGASLPPDMPWLLTCVGMAGRAIAAAGADEVPIHGDGAASNVMRGPGGALLLVDFDRAGQGDPWFDLATTLNELFQFEDEWLQALEQWSGAARRQDYARLRLYAVAEDCYWGLWGLRNAALYRGQGIEFFKYGQWRLLRLRQTLADPRFEAWLRRV